MRLRGFLIRVLNIGLYRIELFRRPRVQFGNLSVNTGNPAIDLVDVVSNFFDLTLSALDLRCQSVGRGFHLVTNILSGGTTAHNQHGGGYQQHN